MSKVLLAAVRSRLSRHTRSNCDSGVYSTVQTDDPRLCAHKSDTQRRLQASGAQSPRARHFPSTVGDLCSARHKTRYQAYSYAHLTCISLAVTRTSVVLPDLTAPAGVGASAYILRVAGASCSGAPCCVRSATSWQALLAAAYHAWLRQQVRRWVGLAAACAAKLQAH